MTNYTINYYISQYMAENSKSRAADVAAALVKSTAETTAANLNIQFIQKDISEIKQNLKDGATKMEQVVKDFMGRDELYVKKDDFNFWRNILVGGLLLTIAGGILSRFFIH